MDKERVLQIIKETMEEELNKDSEYDIKLEKVNIDDIFINYDCDEDGLYYNYFKLMQIDDSIFLVNCKEDGEPYDTVKDIVEEYNDLCTIDEDKLKNIIILSDIVPAK